MNDRVKVPTEGRARRPFTESPTARAVRTKLTTDINQGRFSRRMSTGDVTPNYSTLHNISTRTSDAIRDAENMRAVMTDIDLAEAIVVSSILSPNDFRDPTITWKAEGLEELPPALVNRLIDVCQKFFDTELPLAKMMPDALSNALFRKGSNPILIIPESAIDDVINSRDAVSLESLVQKTVIDTDKKHVRNLGILGSGTLNPKADQKSFSLEDMFSDNSKAETADRKVDNYLTVCDNPAALKMPYLIEKYRAQNVSARLRRTGSMEGINRATRTGLGTKEALDINQLMNNLYSKKFGGQKEVVRINSRDKSSRMPIGHPLVMMPPPESMIPVHTPGNPKDHIGYFILIDELGYPISNATNSTYYQDMINRNHYNRDQVSQTLGRQNLGMNGANCNDILTLNELKTAHANYVELDLLERLRRGAYGDAVTIERPEIVYSIMLARTLAKQYTQLLWVPAELVTYVAFDYNEMGIGQSILERNRLVGMIRSTILFANSLGAMKNSTNHRTLTFRIDPDDMDPEGTFEKQYAEYIRVNASSVPFSSSHPYDQVDQISMSGTSIKIEGAEDILPEVSIDVQDNTGSRVMVDTEYSNSIDKKFWMGIGVTPAMMDSTADIEFAIAAINDNLLFAKRTALRQEVTEQHFTNFGRGYISNSGKLLTELILIVRDFMKNGNQEGLEYDRAAGSRLRGEKPEALVNDEVEKKLAPDPIDNPMHTLDDPATPEGTEPTPESVVETPPEPEDDTYQVVNTNETFKVEPEDEMDIVELFLSKLTMHLPAPDNTKLEDQMAMLTAHEEACTKFLEYAMPDSIMSAVLGVDADANKEAIRDYYKAMYLRQFIAENNILPQLQKMLDPNPDEAEGIANTVEEQGKYMSGMAETIKNIFMAIKARTSTAEELDAGAPAPTTDDGSGGDGSGGLDDGMGDLSGLDDLNLDDTPPPTGNANPEDSSEPKDDGKVEPEVKDDEPPEPEPELE